MTETAPPKTFSRAEAVELILDWTEEAQNACNLDQNANVLGALRALGVSDDEIAAAGGAR